MDRARRKFTSSTVCTFVLELLWSIRQEAGLGQKDVAKAIGTDALIDADRRMRCSRWVTSAAIRVVCLHQQHGCFRADRYSSAYRMRRTNGDRNHSALDQAIPVAGGMQAGVHRHCR
jgi:hypothetical protein